MGPGVAVTRPPGRWDVCLVLPVSFLIADGAGIDLTSSAIRSLPEHDRLLAICRSALSEAYETRFTREREHADLERAIDISEAIIARTGPADPDHPMSLPEHLRLYDAKYEVTHAIEDLRQAIEPGGRSIRRPPPPTRS